MTELAEQLREFAEQYLYDGEHSDQPLPGYNLLLDLADQVDAELAELPERIAAKIEESIPGPIARKSSGHFHVYSQGLQRATEIARSFAPAAEPEPVPEEKRADSFTVAEIERAFSRASNRAGGMIYKKELLHELGVKPEPVREWGVRHGNDCEHSGPGAIWPNFGEAVSKEAAERRRGDQLCSASLVSRVAATGDSPAGPWEAAE